VDVVIPDIQYLRDNRDSVKWVVLTHGHEDHIGAMPFLLREFNLPVFGTSFTIELLKEKLKEHDLLQNARLQKVKPGKFRSSAPSNSNTSGSITAFRRGWGLPLRLLKAFLSTPGISEWTRPLWTARPRIFSGSLTMGRGGSCASLRFHQRGERGVHPERARSGRTLAALMGVSKGRVIVAVFASNITRIQQVVHLASRFHRKIHFSGKSMRTNVRIAKEEGLLLVPSDLEIEEHDIDRLPDDKVVMITTGSQGEPMSSLTRMAENRHKGIKIRTGTWSFCHRALSRATKERSRLSSTTSTAWALKSFMKESPPSTRRATRTRRNSSSCSIS